MHFQAEDPFHYLLAQKLKSNPKNNLNIRLNLSKLPPDFFLQPVSRRGNSLSQRIAKPPNPQNEFLGYNKTVELCRQRKPSSFLRSNSKILQHLDKRQLTAADRRRPEKRRMTQVREQELQGFNCTFARKLYSQAAEGKKILPVLESARRSKGLKIVGIK